MIIVGIQEQTRDPTKEMEVSPMPENVIMDSMTVHGYVIKYS